MMVMLQSCMGYSSRNWFVVVWITLYLIPWPNVDASGNMYTRDSLNSVLYDYAFKNLSKSHTGMLYNVSLPSNMSGIEVSVLRTRTRGLWLHGANVTSFEIPPRILPWPFTRRVDIVYQNLGNWSSFYYNVPYYKFVAPVLGLLAYDSNSSSTNHPDVALNTTEDHPIIVRFHNVSHKVDGVRCVHFGTNGTVRFSNVTARSSCHARGLGHISVVVPYEPIIALKKGSKKWILALAIALGVLALVLLVVLGVVTYKLIKHKRIQRMERESERSEALDSTWIGTSRMPAASGIRTQPVLENNYVP